MFSEALGFSVFLSFLSFRSVLFNTEANVQFLFYSDTAGRNVPNVPVLVPTLVTQVMSLSSWLVF